jgi:ketol-acid reductoisomerase
MALAEPIKERMSEVLEEIRSGSFADEWSKQQPTAIALFEKVREVRDKMPLAKWDEITRSAFKIGNAG